MVDEGGAVVANENGRVKSIRLIASTASHAQRIGEATRGFAHGTRFVRRELLPESGARVWTFHPRSFEPPRN